MPWQARASAHLPYTPTLTFNLQRAYNLLLVHNSRQRLPAFSAASRVAAAPASACAICAASYADAYSVCISGVIFGLGGSAASGMPAAAMKNNASFMTQ